MKSIFVPAISNALKLKKVNEPNDDKFDYKYFTSKSYFKYPYILASTYWQLHHKVMNFRQYYSYPDDYTIIADSGGFQMATFARSGKQMEFTPLQILRWMESNCNIAMNLDIPPWDDFNAALKQSMENFKFFEQNRLNYSMKLYNVLHGNSLDQMKAWYKEVSKFQFDGWALGVKPTDNIYLQTIGYLYLKEKDAINNNNFHMFGMSSIKNMITNAMLADRFGHTITYDSSSYDSGARFRKFMFPKSVKYFMDFGRDSAKTLESIPCKCPVCRNITISDLYDSGDKGYMLLPLHNLYQYIEVNRMINGIVTDDLALTKYCKSVGENKTRSIISHMLNDYDNMSVSKIYDKYKHLMVIGQELPHQGNINSY